MAKIKSVLGVEMDAGAIRAVQMTKGGDGAQVTAFAKVPIERGIIDEGFVRNSDGFGLILGELMARGKFDANEFILGVNNENVIMRYASFPKVPEDKLRKMVELQAQEFIPIPLAEMEIDFVVVGEDKNDDDQPILNILLVGARRNMLENLITLFNAAKLKTRDIDSSVLAWCREALRENPGRTFGLLKLSDDSLNFIAIDKGTVKMVRSISIPERSAYQVRSIFDNPGACDDEDHNLIANLLSSELSSSISYYQMQGYAPLETVFFSALAESEQLLLDKIKELAFVPVEAAHFCSAYENAGFSAAEYTGCISLALEALEG